MKALILATSFFLHIADDYYFQGLLASMKQKSWWEKQYSDDLLYKEKQKKLYGKDYLMALAEHAFSWSFITNLPYLVFAFMDSTLVPFYIISLSVNTIIHAVVDDAKANKFKINLIQDQSIHFVQLVITWLIWVLI